MVYLRYYGYYIYRFTCVIIKWIYLLTLLWLLYIGSYKMVYLRYYGYYI